MHRVDTEVWHRSTHSTLLPCIPGATSPRLEGLKYASNDLYRGMRRAYHMLPKPPNSLNRKPSRARNRVVEPVDPSSIEVLVVDEEHTVQQSCCSILRAEGFGVTECRRADDALRLLRNRSFDIALIDLHLSRVPALEVVERGIEANPDLVVITMSDRPTVESSLLALQIGAWDYLPKPFSATHFEVMVGRAAHEVMVRRAAAEPEDPAERDDPDNGATPLIGQSPELRRVLEVVRKVARTDASVFITGESGTGKEVIANYIHAISKRADKPLVAVNCAAIPESLLESEMFGHVEGAFTGAVRAKEGLLEAANGGTLFLDELTEMPLTTQAKLLRVLQDGVIRRVGSTKTDAVVDVRFIAATNRDPNEAIEAGDLRQDLHYRLRVVPIDLPPLRERPGDIPLLADAFLREFWSHHRMDGEERPDFTANAVEALVEARWPGNVRELRNVVERAVVLADPGAPIRPSDLVFSDGPGGAEDWPASHASDPAVTDQDYHTAREQVISRFEERYLRHVVESAGGNISDAARMAGVDRTTLYRLMEKHGIDRRRVGREASDN